MVPRGAMTEIKNSRIIQQLLAIIYNVIARRATHRFAVEILEKVLHHMQSQYEFIKNIHVQNIQFLEEGQPITVDTQIEDIATEHISHAINDILVSIIIQLMHDAEHYIVREIQDEIEHELKTALKNIGIDLDFSQFWEFIYQKSTEKSRTIQMRNYDIVHTIIDELDKLLRKYYPDKDAIQVLKSTLKKLENKYQFLTHISIDDKPNQDGTILMTINSNIDNEIPSNVVEFLRNFIIEIGRLTDAKMSHPFIEEFESVLAPEDFLKIKKIGIKLEEIDRYLRQQKHELLIQHLFTAIIDLASKELSQGEIMKSCNDILQDLRGSHSVFHYVNIDMNQYTKGIEAFHFSSEINRVDSYLVGKAIRDLLQEVNTLIIEESSNFIENIKKRLGAKYTADLEKIGVNFHMLELKFLR